jgi:hypothetical protein
MALDNFVWKITGIRKANTSDISNIIIGTNWSVTATDTDCDLEGTFTGATPFGLATVDPDNFTPYESLTESQVLSWIQTSVSSSATGYWDHITERIQKQIDEKKYSIAQVMEVDLPWSGSIA